MPRVIVTTDQHQTPDTYTLLDERVNSVHVSDRTSAQQLIERIGWAIGDAEEAERAERHQRASA
ncbi:MAG TPA: hypothetical protein VK272_05760 [Solirubrobacteraceae bacterium]|nr:hypothetical protein [Solirubrobacteraceae bacterium]